MKRGTQKGQKIETHRGRPKAGKKSIIVLLTPSEADALSAMAERQCRSRTSQAVWIIKQAIEAEGENHAEKV